MMQSAHTPPAPPDPDNGMPGKEEFDDPFDNMSSSNLDDLALSSDNNNGNDSATAAAVEDEADPWAVLAAAAGEEAQAPSPTAMPTAAAVPPTIEPMEMEQQQQQPNTTTLAHAEGENFAMPNLSNQQNQPPSLVDQIQSSTANLTHVLAAKIKQVDAKTGISTKARTVDEQYHLTEKWTNFQTNVVKPTTAKTVEKTKEVGSTVKEKVAPSVKEHWGSIKQRSTEIGITQKWSSLSSVVGSKWNETREQVGGSVEHWKEEQEKKRALANASNGEEQGSSQTHQQQQLQQNLEGAKEKVVESWTGGMNWVSQRIQAAKEQQQQSQQSSGGIGGAVSDKETRRLDSDGLPSSFRKD